MRIRLRFQIQRWLWFCANYIAAQRKARGKGNEEWGLCKWEQLRSGQSFGATLAATSGRQHMENARIFQQLRLIKMITWGTWGALPQVVATPISNCAIAAST